MKPNFEKIKGQYSHALGMYGDSPKAVLWPKGRQDARFSALIEPALSLDGERLTLCDFGCGLAHMQQYLEQHAIDKFLYSRYDIVPQMVEKSETWKKCQ